MRSRRQAFSVAILCGACLMMFGCGAAGYPPGEENASSPTDESPVLQPGFGFPGPPAAGKTESEVGEKVPPAIAGDQIAQVEKRDIPADAEVPRDAAGDKPPAPSPKPQPVPISRRIIYTATLTLVVSDFTEVESRIAQLVEDAGGYVANIDLSRRTGVNRSGHWTIRIPVPSYQEFLDQLEELGVPENLKQNAQDVTQQYIDLEARISNQKRLEERLLNLLQNHEGELKEVIEVERELARVRSEIEQMQGRLRYLQNQIAFTTVTISVREEQDYKPPQAPTFGMRIAHTWATSLDSLARFGKGAVLVSVAVAPWLVLVIPAAILVRWLWRSRRGRKVVA